MNYIVIKLNPDSDSDSDSDSICDSIETDNEHSNWQPL